MPNYVTKMIPGTKNTSHLTFGFPLLIGKVAAFLKRVENTHTLNTQKHSALARADIAKYF